jgi:hypothetical protein
MGHDITIGNDAHAYISFNWSCYKDIFHIEEIHGHNNADGKISRRLLEALKVLRDRGATPPPGGSAELKVDGWGRWKQLPELGAGVLVEVVVEQDTAGSSRSRLGRVEYVDDTLFVHVRFDEGCKVRDFVLFDDDDRKDDRFGETDNLATVVGVVAVDCRRVRVASHDFDSLECMRMFAYIIQGFLELAEKYPNATWRSDQVFTTKPLY